ncbi:acylphosphatase [Marinovum sp.]|uniref:acylphosphatase n=1 Tax=Marinovum sp. TaxID=2024839 RepID=UPI002B2723F8|nr:acylphosphatase [Marinovum sp.]
MADKIARRARVMGRVQGVAFRAWTQGQAENLGVQGWVCNNPDGSVSALVVGPPDKVEAMLDSMWAGPGAAAVRDVSVEAVTPVPEVTGFEITG